MIMMAYGGFYHFLSGLRCRLRLASYVRRGGTARKGGNNIEIAGLFGDFIFFSIAAARCLQ